MDERELIQRMKSGDRAAFDQIYENLREQGGCRRCSAGHLCHLLALHQTAAQRGELSLLDLPDHDADCKEKGKRAQQTVSGRGHSEQNRSDSSEPQNGSSGRIRTHCRQNSDRRSAIRIGPGIQRSDRPVLL